MNLLQNFVLKQLYEIGPWVGQSLLRVAAIESIAFKIIMVHRGHVKIEWASMPLIDVWTSRCMPVAVIAKRLPRNYLARGLLSSLLLSFYEINNPKQPAPSMRPSREIVVREPFRRLGPCLYTRAHTCTVTYMSAGRFLHSPGHDCICKSVRSGHYCMADTIASDTGLWRYSRASKCDVIRSG